ncbi:unnamed protein product [Chironomus riparius]|uniref:Uncharacterized protein n=1 Tax=Chironomus riparius TaxID=315576 RepID=A0A9N9WQ78_9DIPT|nr:unnamed protein product [Chironomus riparius]
MNQFTVTSILLILLQVSRYALGSGKIVPVGVDSQSNGNKDLKTEEARFRDPVMPEYYDRDRTGFVTSNQYGNNNSPYDRYGYNNNNFDRATSQYYANRFPGGYDSRERYGNTPTLTGNSFIDNKLNYLSGYGAKFPYGAGSAVFGPYGSPSIGGQTGIQVGPQAGIGGMGGLGGLGGHGAPGSGLLPPGLLSPELEAKASLLLPLAGAALLGIAAYAIVTGPGLALAGPVIGKRRRRSASFDQALEKHLAYRAHKQASQKH